jgi:monofunctional biosynthetic peptidoglycan transglycosylase
VARAGKTRGDPDGKTGAKGRRARAARRPRSRLRRFLRWAARIAAGAVAAVLALVVLFSVVNPPVTHTIWSEWRRLGAVERTWVGGDAIAPVMFRAVVAAEDANFCRHWGFDMAAIRAAIGEGAERGASTLSQQTVKNVYLWQGRSWVRKALEAALTPLVEAVWTKRRILVVYLNVAEFGDGIFGVEAAARHYWGIPAAELTPAQAARLAVVLPNPRGRDPTALGPGLRRRAAQVEDGAETIRADGRAGCFEEL